MSNKYLKPLILASALCLPASAMADWPVAIVDKVAVHPAQSSVTIDALENDIGNGLEIIAVNAWSENGARVFKSNFGISYRPPKNHTGEDGFWYVIKDSEGRTNAARISVNVLPASSALPAPQEDFATIPKDTPIRINVLKNDLFTTTTPTGSNGFGDITQFNSWSQKGGRIEKIITDPPFDEFDLRYTPPKGFVGTDTFWYVVRDTSFDQAGTLPQATKVTIKVLANTKIQDPYPIANPNTFDVTCSQFSCTTPSSIASNDLGKNLIYKLSSPWSLKGGRVSISNSILSKLKSLNYKPKVGFTGQDKVWYTIEDEYGRKNWSVLTLNVTDNDLL